MATAHRPHVLVVDDDDCFRTFVCGALSRGGLEPRPFGSGDEALLAARSDPPALAVLDVNLPGISGYELCRALKDEHPGLPVVFLSGERTESFDRVAGLLLGADDYLVKPVAEDELLVRLRRLLRPASTRIGERGPLTGREFDVLGLLAEGKNQRQIAAELVISAKTVGTHIEHIVHGLLHRHGLEQFEVGLLHPKSGPAQQVCGLLVVPRAGVRLQAAVEGDGSGGRRHQRQFLVAEREDWFHFTENPHALLCFFSGVAPQFLEK